MSRSYLLCCCLVGVCAVASSSKLPDSRVASVDESGKKSEDCTAEPPAPNVQLDGKLLDAASMPIETTLEIDGRTLHLRPLHEELQLTYVHGLLAPEEIDELVRLATVRGGWGRSPLINQQSGDSVEGSASTSGTRNSSSCPMLWPLVYASRVEELKNSGKPNAASLVEELALVGRLTRRVAEVFTQSGMECSERNIEPLQLVRYEPSEGKRPPPPPIDQCLRIRRLRT